MSPHLAGCRRDLGLVLATEIYGLLSKGFCLSYPLLFVQSQSGNTSSRDLSFVEAHLPEILSHTNRRRGIGMSGLFRGR